ncbi:uncharacterized protein [Halyomorpha halys]|uniref:uncharacterized protein n=1 Tax=Halyomorpha halys TaxID=286706 RepID=UPI0006D5186E|nr:uncharacterized protein LOC106685958 [Halyomorpha halys]
MSSDATKKLDEHTLEPKELQESLKAASPILIKIFEVVISLLCFFLVFVPYDNNLSTSVHKAGLVWVAFTLPVLVNIISLISHFRRIPLPKLSLCWFSSLFGILLFSAGCILVSEWWILMHSIQFRPAKLFMDLMMSCAVFSFFLSMITILDVYVTYKYY